MIFIFSWRKPSNNTNTEKLSNNEIMVKENMKAGSPVTGKTAANGGFEKKKELGTGRSRKVHYEVYMNSPHFKCMCITF